MHNKPKILNRKMHSQSKLFTIEQVDLEFSNGTRTQFERLLTQGAGAVMIIPVLNNEQVIMIHEYAVATERYELVFPKGKIDDGEDILQAANRECMEEIGYRADKLTLLGSMSIAPGYLNLMTYIVLAENLQPEKRQGDEPEALQQVVCDLNNFNELITHENLSEARSIAALYQVRDILRERAESAK